MTGVTDERRRGVSLLLMGASGFAGLGYQIVWTQQCSLWLGHESAAVLAVVTAFFGGLAVGGLTLGARIEKSAAPVRWYAGCELVIAAWSLLLLVAGPTFGRWISTAVGVEPSPFRHWSVAFCGAFLVFLPATAAMGATLPAMERLTTPLREDGRSIAALYASNTFGAVLGVLAGAFWLIPTFGLARSAAVCIVLNVLCGATAWAAFPRTEATASPPLPPLQPDARRARAALLRLAITGFLGIGYEVLVVRVLSQVTEDTVYTFALLLAVYLVGSAAGAAAYHRWLAAQGAHEHDDLGDRLLAALAVACLLGTALLFSVETVKAGLHDVLGDGAPAALAGEATLALLAFGPATALMGATFSHLSRCASAAGVGFGRSLGVNTLAAAAAPAAFGVVALPALGAKASLMLVVAGYLVATGRRAWASPTVWAPAVFAAAFAALTPPLRFVEVPAGGHVVSYREGVMAAVSVVEDADGVARLRIDNRQQEGSSATRRVDARQAWLPLLLHPAPRHALFLGLGTGVTASSAAEDPALDVDAVELLPEVIAASAGFVASPAATGDASNGRLHVLAADARRYVRVTDRQYDVIVSDNFHPARSGSGALYTVEHFTAVSRRLAKGGVFCQWLPLHQLDLGTLRSIVRSFVTVYPGAWAMLASNSLETPVIGLVASNGPRRFDAAAVRARLARLAPLELPHPPLALGLEDELAVLGSFVAGPSALTRFAAAAEANTDDHPVVAYGAPRVTYAADTSPRDRLMALMQRLSIAPDELLVPTTDPDASHRLAAYWAARDRFLESGRYVRRASNVRAMLAEVREPLLEILRISPDFRPAYDPLLAMANALASSDASASRALLTELTRLQPSRDEASRGLAAMAPAPRDSDPAQR